MENRQKGLFGATKVFSVIFAAFTFAYGLFLSIVYSFARYYYNGANTATVFKPGVFVILLFLLFLYLAFPIVLTFMLFKVQHNKKILLPAFILSIAIMPIGGSLGISSLLMGSYSSTGYLSTLNSTLFSIDAIMLIIYLHIAVTLFVLISVLLFTNKSSENCQKKSVVEDQKAMLLDTSETSNAFETITKAKQLLDSGILTEEEFKEIKAKLL